MSQDPIRDGMNWYTYCGGDSINYTDPDGNFIYSLHSWVKMNEGPWVDKRNTINGTETLISDEGCAMTGVANIDTQNKIGRGVAGPPENITTPLDLNNAENFSTLDGHKDEVDWSKIGDSIGLTATRSSTSGSKAEQAKAAQNMVNSAGVSPKGSYLMVQAPVTTDKGKVSHWVGVSGGGVDLKNDGEIWLSVVGTSKYDNSGRKRNSNWTTDSNGNLYVKLSAITGAVTFE